ncbi:MAG TPA: PilW family protein [Anaeromyxobacter sp.]|nr:PilW family protein [Anaeromyxobacter sp.]
MRTPSRHAGVTLVELLVALAVSSAVLVGVVAVARSQQQAYYDGARVRAAQASARNALLFFEQKVAQAGFGMAPSLAFDFDRSGGPCPAELSTGGTPDCVRDRTNDSDELVFYARNPVYWVPQSSAAEPSGRAWRVTALSSTELTVNAREGQTFRKGQVLLVVCDGATQYAYLTVSTTTAAPSGGGSVDLPLVTASSTHPFLGQDTATNACFNQGTARAFQIDRYRIHVRPVDVGGGRRDPYLVLDQGVDMGGSTAIDEADEQFIAEGIESIQVAYVLANGTQVGTAAAVTLAAGAPGDSVANKLTTLSFPGAAPVGSESVYSPTSWYRYYMGPPPAAERRTNHQANIRAVRIAVVARSPEPDPAKAWIPPILNFNQTAAPAWIGGGDGYQRVSFETTIPLPNMITQGMVYF